ncbi:MAG: T9SS type A sorting domain-containing protein [Bacteroidota bacterium]
MKKSNPGNQPEQKLSAIHYSAIILLVMFFSGSHLHSQNQPASGIQPKKDVLTPTVAVHPSLVIDGVFWGESRPLRDIPPLTAMEWQELKRKGIERIMNPKMQSRTYPYSDVAMPKGEDGARQREMGSRRFSRSPQVNFEGQTSLYTPSDANGMAGSDFYMQTVNCAYAIYDKEGDLLAGPTNLNQLFGNVPGAGRNDGDPIIQYDEQADRWLVTEFSVPKDGTQNYLLMAVSTTSDPTGAWYQYSFAVPFMPDYPKYGVWRDGYYCGVNNEGTENDIFVFERSEMLLGGTARMVAFKNPYRPISLDNFMVTPPLDNDMTFAPEGSPGLFIAFNDDATGGGNDQLWIYELAVNWNAPNSSTFNRVQQLDVEPFSGNFGADMENIRQKGTTRKLDAVPQVIMNAPQYRNFGAYQTIVCCHTVNVDGKGHAGVRWYELRKTDTTWFIRQQSTYAPDTNSRWMGSILLNGHNTIGLGYSISSNAEFPGIRYCGQSDSAYLAGNSILDIAEDTILSGTMSQSANSRWGDYSSVSIDPSDDETFWYTNQYSGVASNKTRIASFKFESGPIAVNEMTLNRIFIYPNPASGIVQIVPATDETAELHVTVEDQNGKIIARKKFSGKKEYSLNLSSAPQGVYYILIKTEGWQVTKKLVLLR